MSSSIRISEKHGVNPSLVMCFWCGESKAVALLGRLPNDAEAPRQMCMDYEPCDKCKAKFRQGVMLAECKPTPRHDNQLPMSKDPDTGKSLFPTGRYLVVHPRILNVPTHPGEMAAIDAQTFEFLLNGGKKNERQE